MDIWEKLLDLAYGEMSEEAVAMREAAWEIERLRAELEAAIQSASMNMAEKHKERAEAKLWFEKAQEWRAELQRRDASETLAAIDGELHTGTQKTV